MLDGIQLSDAARRVLAALQLGQRSQISLRAELGLSDEQFQAAREELAGRGLVVPYRCRGGGLRLAPADALPGINAAAIEQARQHVLQPEAALQEQLAERDLYLYVQRWALNAGYGTAKIIGDNHRRSSWENPDLVALDCYEHEWLVGSEYEVTTIEVKLAFDIFGIWQAAHYRRFSHFVYLACYETPDAIRRAADGRMLDVAVELGLGVLSLSPSGRGLGCNELSSPARQTPIPREVDRLLNDYSDLLELRRPGRRILEQMAAAQQ